MYKEEDWRVMWTPVADDGVMPSHLKGKVINWRNEFEAAHPDNYVTSRRRLAEKLTWPDAGSRIHSYRIDSSWRVDRMNELAGVISSAQSPSAMTECKAMLSDLFLHRSESLLNSAIPKLDMPEASGGGSSSYYELTLPPHVLAAIKSQIEAGDDDVIIQTGDCIEMLVGNDFDGGNIIKALRRIFEGKKGTGKAGTEPKYDLDKCHYFLDEVEKKL